MYDGELLLAPECVLLVSFSHSSMEEEYLARGTYALTLTAKNIFRASLRAPWGVVGDSSPGAWLDSIDVYLKRRLYLNFPMDRAHFRYFGNFWFGYAKITPWAFRPTIASLSRGRGIRILGGVGGGNLRTLRRAILAQ